MGPSRRDLLRATGLATTVGLAGCVGASFLDGGSEPPRYLDWLASPGRLVAPGEYRVGIVRPAATPNAGTRLAPFLPEIQVPSIDPADSEQLVVSQGVTVLTTDVDRSTVVSAYQDAGYSYERGIGEFWILDDGDSDTPVIAAGAEAVLVARPTARESAVGVVETLLHAYDSADHWTRSDPSLRAFTESIGNSSALVFSLASWEQTVPRRGQFAGIRAHAISHDFSEPQRSYAFLFADSGDLPTAAVSSWVDTAVSDLEDPRLETEAPVVTVTGSPVDSERVRTNLPTADQRWSGLGADSRRSATLPDGNPPRGPVRERWLFVPEDERVPPSSAEGDSPRDTPLSENGQLRFNPPAVDDGTVFVTGGDCYALDARDGRLLWEAGLGKAGGTPVLDGQRVYCTAAVEGAQAVVALDAASGSTEWTWHPPTGPVSTVVQNGDYLFVATSSPNLSDGVEENTSTIGPHGIFALEGGTEVWRQTGSAVDSIAIAGKTVVAAGGQTAATVTAREISDGTQLWQRELDVPLWPRVSVADGRVVVTGREDIVGLSLADGTTQWRVNPDRTMTFTRAALVDGLAYVGAARPPSQIREQENGGTLRALDLAEGGERFRIGQTRRVTARPVVAGDGVFVVSGGGALARFDRDLTRAWTLYMSGGLGAPVVSGGSVYVPTALGPLGALGTEWLPGPASRFIATRQTRGDDRL
jgi:hypothetical protein